MKVLLDENLPHLLRNHLAGHDVFTAVYAGFAGLKNGKLLEAADSGGFNVLLTGDTTLRHEQNLANRTIGVILLSAVEWPFIEPHLRKIAEAIDRCTPGSFVRVECGSFSRSRPRTSGPSGVR